MHKGGQNDAIKILWGKKTDLGVLYDVPLTAVLLEIMFISGVKGNFMTSLLLTL